MLRLGFGLLERWLQDSEKTQASIAEALLNRVQALLDGVARNWAPAPKSRPCAGSEREAFAGNIRLAPRTRFPGPSNHRARECVRLHPLELTPVEWRGQDGRRVFGWRLSE